MIGLILAQSFIREDSRRAAGRFELELGLLADGAGRSVLG